MSRWGSLIHKTYRTPLRRSAPPAEAVAVLNACRAYALDVGMDEGGRWSVIKTNPAWSSNPPYWATEHDAGAVVATIPASQQPGAGPEWVPEPSQVERARPLPIRGH